MELRMSGSEQKADTPKSVEDLTAALAELQLKFDNLTTAHTKAKDDLRDAKATAGDAGQLQKQIDKLTTEKSSLMVKVTTAEDALKAYKDDVTKDKVKTAVVTALTEAGALKPSTAMKIMDLKLEELVDENGNVLTEKASALVTTFKTEEPELFGTPATPGKETKTTVLPEVKRAADRLTQSGYEQALAAAVKTGKQSEIDAVAAQFGIA